MTFDDLNRSNKGYRIFMWFYIINGSSYQQSLLEIHIASLIKIMAFQFTVEHLTFDAIERASQGH